ncbi:MAG: hypothetical protein FJW32_02885 [Acidobacteria bacterium]|nr:hypothetical protein [Acidobacteriota bacterium]
MSIVDKINGLLADPPPEFAFELSEAGLAWNAPLGRGFTPFESGTLRVSPSEENILRPDAVSRAIREVVGESSSKKRRTAVVILPDYAGRTTILDFDTFPARTEEQEALIKFRLKKSVPFDVDSSAFSFQPQTRGASKSVDVVASAISLETLARYESPFRAAGLHVGVVTMSTLAALETVPAHGCRMLVKLSGLVLTIAVVDDGALRLLRTLELPEVSPDAIWDHLGPTLVYLEDEWKRKPEAVYVAGIDPHWLGNEAPVEPLPGPFGAPQAHNAGLLGWLAAGGRA